MTSTVNQYGRPGSKAARLREAVHRCLLAHEAAGELPTSNRFVYYELVQTAEVVDKTKRRSSASNGQPGSRGADQDLAVACKWLRDLGLVPWWWIIDETRQLTSYRYADTVAGFVAESVDRARIDVWAAAPAPLLLCESRTFGGVMERGLAQNYLCPVTATNGQVGGFLHTNVAPILADGNRPVLYVGDFDWQGGQIEANTRRVLEGIVGPLDWTRVALTAEQVAARPDIPVIQKEDRRYRPPRVHEAVEVEALGQGPVVALVRAALDELPPEPLDVVLGRESEQKHQTRERLARPVE
jgi:hypothetical protein